MHNPGNWSKFLVWRSRRIPLRNFILILSIITGLLSGLAAALLKNLVFYIRQVHTLEMSELMHLVLYVISPVIGLLLVFLFLKYLGKKRLAAGIPATLRAMAKRKGLLPMHSLFTSLVGAILTSGFGGSAGLEGPAIGTSSSIGSHLGRLFKLNYKSMILLMACGAAGSMAGLFGAPIAAVIFALEVLMLDLTLSSIVPLLLASVSAAITSQLILGDSSLLHTELQGSFHIEHLPFYLLLGVLGGLTSAYFSKTFWGVERLVKKLKKGISKQLVSGLLIGGMIVMVPALLGEGYETINHLLSGTFSSIQHGNIFSGIEDEALALLLTFFLLSILKVFAASLTIHGGGIGGIFAPTLFTGAILGAVLTHSFGLLGFTGLSDANFALVGMCALISGVIHAPLTAIFLIAEITGSYELFLPLMLVSAISYFTSKALVKQSIYTVQLHRKGELITHDTDHSILTIMLLQKEIETNFEVLRNGQSLGDVVQSIARSKRNIFPVVDEENRFLGVIMMDEIRDVIFHQELYESVKVETLMIIPPDRIQKNDSMEMVMEKFSKTGAWNLPVLDGDKYLGFVSKSKILSDYRELIKEISEE